jgi:hypothetical protein
MVDLNQPFAKSISGILNESENGVPADISTSAVAPCAFEERKKRKPSVTHAEYRIRTFSYNFF